MQRWCWFNVSMRQDLIQSLLHYPPHDENFILKHFKICKILEVHLFRFESFSFLFQSAGHCMGEVTSTWLVSSGGSDSCSSSCTSSSSSSLLEFTVISTRFAQSAMTRCCINATVALLL